MITLRFFKPSRWLMRLGCTLLGLLLSLTVGCDGSPQGDAQTAFNELRASQGVISAEEVIFAGTPDHAGAQENFEIFMADRLGAGFTRRHSYGGVITYERDNFYLSVFPLNDFNGPEQRFVSPLGVASGELKLPNPPDKPFHGTGAMTVATALRKLSSPPAVLHTVSETDADFQVIGLHGSPIHDGTMQIGGNISDGKPILCTAGGTASAADSTAGVYFGYPKWVGDTIMIAPTPDGTPLHFEGSTCISGKVPVGVDFQGNAFPTPDTLGDYWDKERTNWIVRLVSPSFNTQGVLAAKDATLKEVHRELLQMNALGVVMQSDDRAAYVVFNPDLELAETLVSGKYATGEETPPAEHLLPFAGFVDAMAIGTSATP